MKKNICLFTIFAALLFVNSCTKNDVINNTPIDTKDTSAQVALDWYKLQLRFLLERNSSLNPDFAVEKNEGIFYYWIKSLLQSSWILLP